MKPNMLQWARSPQSEPVEAPRDRGSPMHDEFTAIIEEDGSWYVAYCLEVPGANGQGKTVEECKRGLAEAISLILEDGSQDGLRSLPEDARQIRIRRTMACR